MLPNVAIVGHAADKFTPESEAQARSVIRQIFEMYNNKCTLVSGGCHLGGVDQWAEEIADELGLAKRIFVPAHRSWSNGYKPRNIKIADTCHTAWCIVVEQYPAEYKGMRFEQDGKPFCYHCQKQRPAHVKSGGCWTIKRASRAKKPVYWVLINPERQGEEEIISE